MQESDTDQSSDVAKVEILRKRYPNSKLLFACKVCFQRKPPVIIELDNLSKCSWCSKKEDKLLLLETLFDKCRNIKYDVISEFVSNISIMQLCKFEWRNCNKRENCPYAHSHIELDIWKFEKNNNYLEERSFLVSTLNAEKIDRCKYSATFHCFICSLNFETVSQISEHCESSEHNRALEITQNNSEWKYRPLPVTENQVLCEIVKNKETKSKCPNGELCPNAHSKEELEEWKTRLELQKSIINTAKDAGLLSFIDRILLEYNRTGSPASVFVEKRSDVSIKLDYNLIQRICIEESSFEWTLKIKCNDPNEKLNHAAFFPTWGSTNLFQIYRKRKRRHQPREHINFTENMNETCNLNLFEGTATYKVQFKKHDRGFGIHSSSLVLEFRNKPRPAVKLDFVVRVVDKMDLTSKICSTVIVDDCPHWLTHRKIIPLEKVVNNEYYKKLQNFLNEYTFNASLSNKAIKCENQFSSFDPDCLNPKNYIDEMRRFLCNEEKARSDKLDRVRSFKVAISRNYMPLSNKKLIWSSEKMLFGIFQLPEQLNKDTDEGLLILESCSMVYIARKNDPFENPVYEASIVDKFTDHIVIECSCKCVEDWELKSGMILDAEIRFRLDQERFKKYYFALNKLKKNGLLQLVCPSKKKKKSRKPICVDSVCPLVTGLDEKQRKILAFSKTDVKDAGSFPLLVVHGSFGSGKTHTLSKCVKHLIESDDNARVLICTHSNSAASLYVEKNFQNVHKWRGKVVRVVFHGRKVSTESKLTLKYCLLDEEDSAERNGKIPKSNFRYPSLEEITSYRIFITTYETSLMLGIHRNQENNTRLFTHIFLDEIAQVMEPEAIIPLTLADPETKVVIAGDHMQMSEMIYSKTTGLNSNFTLLKRLFMFYSKFFPDRCIFLNNNYRCAEPILRILEEMFYKEDLLRSCPSETPPKGLITVQFYDTSGICMKDRLTGGYYNDDETIEIARVVVDLLNDYSKDLKQEDIAVVAAYEEQVRKIRTRLKLVKLPRVDVERVNNIQGREFKVVIVSCVHKRKARNDRDGENYGFLSDPNLLNAAFTRTKFAIIVVGHAATLWSLGKCRKKWKIYIKKCMDSQGFFPNNKSMSDIEREALLKNPSFLNPQALEFQPGNQIHSKMNSFSDNESSDDDDDDPDEEMEKDDLLETIVEKVFGIAPDKLKVRTDPSGFEIPIEASRFDHEDSNAERRSFYCEYSLEHLNDFVDKNPDMYKRCVLKFKTWNSATAHVVDRNSAVKHVLITNKQNLNRTFDKDEVVVEIIRKSDEEDGPKFYGKVLGILSRYKDPYEIKFICFPDQENSSLMIPVQRICTKFWISKNRGNTREHIYKIPIFANARSRRNSKPTRYVRYDKYAMSLETKHFVVRFLDWPKTSPHAVGYVENVINPEEFQKYYQILHDVPPSVHPKTVLKEAEEIAKKSCDESRLDLDDLFVFTIDPKDSSDLDDAISLQRCNNHDKCWKVGIHIADVGSVVPQNGKVDLEARKRGQTYYDGERRPGFSRSISPMLPPELSSKKCSLLADGIKRPAISLFIHSASLPVITCSEVNEEDKNLPQPLLSMVKSNLQLTYEQAEAHLKEARQSNEIEDITEANQENIGAQLLIIWRIMLRLRWSRVESASFFAQPEFKGLNQFCKEASAHMLIEEAMITYNACCCHYLKEKRRNFAIRTQQPPFPDVAEKWTRSNILSIELSLYQQFYVKCLGRNEILEMEDNQRQYNNNISVYPHVWMKIEEFLNSNDLDTALILFCSDDLHPTTSFGYSNFKGISEKAYFQLLEEILTQGSVSHFSVNLPYYSQFTSPIRRYKDLELQRLIIEELKSGNESPDPDVIQISRHTGKDLKNMLKKLEICQNNAKSFEKDTQNVSFALSLLKKLNYEIASVIGADEEKIFLQFSDLTSLPSASYQIRFIDLKLHEQNERFLTWKIKFYNVKEYSSISVSTFHNEMTGTFVPRASWISALKSIQKSLGRGDVPSEENSHWNSVKNNFQTLVSSLRTRRPCPSNSGHGPCMSVNCKRVECCDRLEGESLLKIAHYRKIKILISPGTPLLVQLCCSINRGICVPSLQLLALTDDLHICIAHNSSPVEIFASDVRPIKKNDAYSNLTEYCMFWIDLTRLEGVYNSVKTETTPVVLHNVDVTFEPNPSSENKLSGHFTLNNLFCKKRVIELDVDEFLCIRINQTPSSGKDSSFESACIWVVHAVVTEVDTKKVETKYSFISCPLLTSDSSLYNEIAQSRKCHQAAIELIQLDPTHRAFISSLHLIKKVESSMNEKIISNLCLDHPQPSLSFTPIESFVANIGGSMVPGMDFLLNPGQIDQIKTALSQAVTLIQGPPGTGKSYLGAHLAYYFYWYKKENQRENGNKKKNEKKEGKILYCGPSNRSVDVVAKYLLKSKLKILRVYGKTFEEADFPNPLKPKMTKSETEKRPDKIIKEISLHHRIRMPQNPYENAISSFDAQLKKRTVSMKEIEAYNKILAEAKMHEFKNHDIIICTCATAALKKLATKDFAFSHCIIDECGMCCEPETLAPIITSKSPQVVLIGDHKQLQPVIKCKRAKELGMSTSLFERLGDRAGMLTNQYRMVQSICDFPSKHFYENKLKTDQSVMDREAGRGFCFCYPPGSNNNSIFCHVVGKEKRNYSLERGEGSCYNEDEAEVVIKILLYLLRNKVSLSDIMILSPYNAQVYTIRHIIRRNRADLAAVQVESVTNSQGSESDFVILSTVRSQPLTNIEPQASLHWRRKYMGFVIDPHQINVGITRARSSLCIVGNKYLLEKDGETWLHLINDHKEKESLVDFNDPKAPWIRG